MRIGWRPARSKSIPHAGSEHEPPVSESALRQRGQRRSAAIAVSGSIVDDPLVTVGFRTRAYHRQRFEPSLIMWMVSFRHLCASAAARVKIASSIGSVSTPVFVFWRLG